MIKSFRHKRLERFFESDTLTGIQSAYSRRLRSLLNALHEAGSIEDMHQPGFRLHALRGMPRRWSVWVNANWRVTFEFIDGNAYRVDFEDYH